MDRKPTRFELRLPAELGDHIDEWRRAQSDLPPRAEAARRLIELGLSAAPTPATATVRPVHPEHPASGMHVAGGMGGAEPPPEPMLRFVEAKDEKPTGKRTRRRFGKDGSDPIEPD